MKKIVLLLLIPVLSFAQTIIGTDINGENAGDYFGSSVSLSDDGMTMAVGAIYNAGNGANSGHVRVYKNISGVWSQIGSDINGEASGDLFGISVSISSDGTVVAIGANKNDGNGVDSGHVRIFKNISNVWTQIGSDINGVSAGDEFGFSVSLSSDGTIVAIGSPKNDANGTDSGHVVVYKETAGVWNQMGNVIIGEAIGDKSGCSISLSSNGTILAIGANGNDGNGMDSGHVRIYGFSGGVWSQIGADINGESASDNSGASVALSSDGTIVAIGAYANTSFKGHVRVYKNVSNTWTKIGNDIDGEASFDFSGFSVAISDSGNTVAIGAHYNDGINGADSGQVRVYENVSNNWVKRGIDIDGEAANDGSGYSVSLSSTGSVLSIGAISNDGNGANSGHVRVYDLSSILFTNSFNLSEAKIYPNPVNDILNIKLDNNISLKQTNIYNSLGQLIRTVTNDEILFSDFSKGIYYLEIITNEGITNKIIIKK